MSVRLALGSAQFGLDYGIANQVGQVKRSDVVQILHYAREKGLDLLDTAIAYGDSEDSLGACGVSNWKIVSKLPAIPDNCNDIASWVETQVTHSLNKLRVERLYGLLLHNPRELTGPHGVVLASALTALRRDRLTDNIGVSIYSPIDLESIYDKLSINLVQAPLSLVDRRLVQSGWLNRLHADGVEIHTRSSFLQGLLLLSEMPVRFAPWKKLWDRWQNWLSNNPISSVSACLAYPLSFPEVSRVVVGVDSQIQLAQLLSASNFRFSTEKLPDLSCNDERFINPSFWPKL